MTNLFIVHVDKRYVNSNYLSDLIYKNSLKLRYMPKPIPKALQLKFREGMVIILNTFRGINANISNQESPLKTFLVGDIGGHKSFSGRNFCG